MHIVNFKSTPGACVCVRGEGGWGQFNVKQLKAAVVVQPFNFFAFAIID